jgi:hypothetical protein
MNERIKELAEQARMYALTLENRVDDCNDVFEQKFAELMIVEFTETVKQTAILVAQTAYNNGETEANVNKRVNATMRVLDVMRERFGVEE